MRYAQKDVSPNTNGETPLVIRTIASSSLVEVLLTRLTGWVFGTAMTSMPADNDVVVVLVVDNGWLAGWLGRAVVDSTIMVYDASTLQRKLAARW